MKEEQKKQLLDSIAARMKLNALNASRLRRLLKAPLHSIDFYFKQAIAYLHPYKVRRQTLWGDMMEYYLPEAATVYYYGFWEAGLTNFIVKSLKPGETFLDIGSHVGFYALLASKLVGESGQVHAFEPTPRTFLSLKKNLANKSNAQSYNVAVLDSQRDITFTDYGPKYSAFNTFKKRKDGHMSFLGNGETITVPAISLDNFCAAKNISPTFIKIDVEGAEHAVLKSMERILRDIKPTLSIEVGSSDDLKENTLTSTKFLRDRGYVGFTITDSGNLILSNQENEAEAGNLVFVHSSKTFRYE